MRKRLFMSLCALLAMLAVQAQTGGATIVRAEYFFDKDPGYGQATIINNVTAGENTLSLSTDGLSPGAHTLYVRSQGSTGVWSATQAHTLFVSGLRGGQPVRLEYFFDSDPGYGMATAITDVAVGAKAYDFSVESVTPGIHNLFFRVQDANGIWSATQVQTLYIAAAHADQVARLEYFFDADPGYGKGSIIEGVAKGEQVLPLNIDNLMPGVHCLYLRSQDHAGVWSSVVAHPFLVVGPRANGIARIEYFFDTDPGYGQATAVASPQNGEAAYALSIDHLTLGAHMLYVRSQDETGVWSSVMAHPFVVLSGQPDIVAMEYYLDEDDPGAGQATAVVLPANKTAAFAFEVQTDALTPGEHKIHLRGLDSWGTWRDLGAEPFTVIGATPVVEAPVTGYDGRYITLESATADATIYYTTDGTEPTDASAEYTGKVEMTELCTVKAVAMKEGTASDVSDYVVRYLFNGTTAWVEEPDMLDEAFVWCNGRSEAAKTIAAIVSLSTTSAMTDTHVSELKDNPNLLVYVDSEELAPAGVKNVVVRGQAGDIVLTDVTTGNGNFFAPQEFTAATATYTRNFQQQTEPNVSRGWEAITLPFDVQRITHEKNGLLSPFGAEDENSHRFWLRQLTPDGIRRTTAIRANRPYVISMPNNTEAYDAEFIQAGLVTFDAANVTIPATHPEPVALADGSITMMPTTLHVAQSNDVYALNVGVPQGNYREGSIFVRGLRDVYPFEAYTLHAGSGQNGSPYITFADMGMADATGIREVTDEDRTDAPVYDLQGRRVADSTLNEKPLTKGVYIQRGRKVVIGR